MAENTELLEQTTEITASYVSNNNVPVADLPALINRIYGALLGSEKGKEVLKPAVPIKQSVKPGYIVCLECGKKNKMAKRHIKTAHNLSEDEYRERWNLPKEYRLVSDEYAATRSALAKKIGLGRGPKRGRGRKK